MSRKVVRSARRSAGNGSRKPSPGNTRDCGVPAEAGSSFQVVETAFGFVGLVMKGRAVVRTTLPAAREDEILLSMAREGIAPGKGTKETAPVVRMLKDYFRGKAVDPAACGLDLDYGTVGPFVKSVYEALRRVPRGCVVTYGELAARAGAPGAARAVGTAMARNALPLLVPCHRVVASGGIGGFGGVGGVELKRRLLALEGTPGHGSAATR